MRVFPDIADVLASVLAILLEVLAVCLELLGILLGFLLVTGLDVRSYFSAIAANFSAYFGPKCHVPKPPIEWPMR